MVVWQLDNDCILLMSFVLIVLNNWKLIKIFGMNSYHRRFLMLKAQNKQKFM